MSEKHAPDTGSSVWDECCFILYAMCRSWTTAGDPCNSWLKKGATCWAVHMRCSASTGTNPKWDIACDHQSSSSLSALCYLLEKQAFGTFCQLQQLTWVVLCVLRDADETKEWIEEKNQALNTDNYGHDLASVQALQRKHEGFERDLAALGDKVRFTFSNFKPEILYLFFINFPISLLRLTLLERQQSAWSSLTLKRWMTSRRNAQSWTLPGAAWWDVLTSAKTSLAIPMTCSVSSLTSGGGGTAGSKNV